MGRGESAGAPQPQTGKSRSRSVPDRGITKGATATPFTLSSSPSSPSATTIATATPGAPTPIRAKPLSRLTSPTPVTRRRASPTLTRQDGPTGSLSPCRCSSSCGRARSTSVFTVTAAATRTASSSTAFPIDGGGDGVARGARRFFLPGGALTAPTLRETGRAYPKRANGASAIPGPSKGVAVSASVARLRGRPAP